MLWITWRYSRKKLSRSLFLIILYFLADLGAALLSGRRYLHYFLPAAISGSWLIAYYFSLIWPKLRRSEKLAQLLISLLVGIFSVSYLIYGLAGNAGNKFKDPRYFTAADYLDYFQKVVTDHHYNFYYNFYYHLFHHSLGSDDYLTFFNQDEFKLQSLKFMTDRYAEDQVYIYTNNGWAYYYTGKIIPTKIFVAFQLFYQGNGDYQKDTMVELK
ncbi:MAG: hypothetical protein WCJ58_04265 [bacterium]